MPMASPPGLDRFGVSCSLKITGSQKGFKTLLHWRSRLMLFWPVNVLPTALLVWADRTRSSLFLPRKENLSPRWIVSINSYKATFALSVSFQSPILFLPCKFKAFGCSFQTKFLYRTEVVFPKSAVTPLFTCPSTRSPLLIQNDLALNLPLGLLISQWHRYSLH
jgi:hypothetical protein